MKSMKKENFLVHIKSEGKLYYYIRNKVRSLKV